MTDVAKGSAPQAKIEVSYGSSRSESTASQDSAMHRESNVRQAARQRWWRPVMARPAAVT